MLRAARLRRVGKDVDMRQLRNVVAAVVIGAGAPAPLVAPAFAQTCTCPPSGTSPAYSPSGTGPSSAYLIQASEPPPPLPVYDQPPIPALNGPPPAGWLPPDR